MIKTADIKPWKIVSVDPGYRNLAWVAFSFHPITHEVKLLYRRHVDVGPCSAQTDIICKVWTVVRLAKPFLDADYCIIEDQMIGPQTKPNNQGLAWLLATMALEQSPSGSIYLISAKNKFSVFKDLPLPYKLPRGLKISKTERRKRTKANSLWLANILLQKYDIAPGRVFDAAKPKTWEHLADAVGMAMACIKAL